MELTMKIEIIYRGGTHRIKADKLNLQKDRKVVTIEGADGYIGAFQYLRFLKNNTHTVFYLYL